MSVLGLIWIWRDNIIGNLEYFKVRKEGNILWKILRFFFNLINNSHELLVKAIKLLNKKQFLLISRHINKKNFIHYIKQFFVKVVNGKFIHQIR